MANKADRFYYENFIEAADCACKAADYLVECLSAFDPQKWRPYWAQFMSLRMRRIKEA